MNRRDLLKQAGTAAAGLAATNLTANLTAADETKKEELGGEMLYRQLGKTGVKVSAIGLGGHHIGRIQDDKESIRLVHEAIDRGITFMDNCWDYHDGRSEELMGRALENGYRKKVVLMTKIDGRTREKSAQQIDESLKRLRTDCIDLMQIHEVIRLEDPDRCFAEGGTIEALKDARKAGKIRFIGFTGHKDPIVHLRMLDTAARYDFHFDAAQMPLNVMDAHFRSFTKLVVPRLVSEGIAVLGMKPIADGNILLSKTVTAVECLLYALSLPTSVVITGIESMERLDQAIHVVRGFQPLTDEQMASLLARTKEAALTGHFEPFKTTSGFDGTAHNPQWLS